MKTALSAILAASTLAISAPAAAQHHHGYVQPGPVYVYPAQPNRGYIPPRPVYRNGNWVIPAIIAGVGTAIVVDQIYRQHEVYVQPPVQVQPPIQVQPAMPVCSGWVEIRNPDGTITQSRTCNQ